MGLDEDDLEHLARPRTLAAVQASARAAHPAEAKLAVAAHMLQQAKQALASRDPRLATWRLDRAMGKPLHDAGELAAQHGHQDSDSSEDDEELELAAAGQRRHAAMIAAETRRAALQQRAVAENARRAWDLAAMEAGINDEDSDEVEEEEREAEAIAAAGPLPMLALPAFTRKFVLDELGPTEDGVGAVLSDPSAPPHQWAEAAGASAEVDPSAATSKRRARTAAASARVDAAPILSETLRAAGAPAGAAGRAAAVSAATPAVLAARRARAAELLLGPPTVQEEYATGGSAIVPSTAAVGAIGRQARATAADRTDSAAAAAALRRMVAAAGASARDRAGAVNAPWSGVGPRQQAKEAVKSAMIAAADAESTSALATHARKVASQREAAPSAAVARTEREGVAKAAGARAAAVQEQLATMHDQLLANEAAVAAANVKQRAAALLAPPVAVRQPNPHAGGLQVAAAAASDALLLARERGVTAGPRAAAASQPRVHRQPTATQEVRQRSAASRGAAWEGGLAMRLGDRARYVAEQAGDGRDAIEERDARRREVAARAEWLLKNATVVADREEASAVAADARGAEVARMEATAAALNAARAASLALSHPSARAAQARQASQAMAAATQREAAAAAAARATVDNAVAAPSASRVPSDFQPSWAAVRARESRSAQSAHGESAQSALLSAAARSRGATSTEVAAAMAVGAAERDARGDKQRSLAALIDAALERTHRGALATQREALQLGRGVLRALGSDADVAAPRARRGAGATEEDAERAAERLGEELLRSVASQHDGSAVQQAEAKQAAVLRLLAWHERSDALEEADAAAVAESMAAALAGPSTTAISVPAPLPTPAQVARTAALAAVASMRERAARSAAERLVAAAAAATPSGAMAAADALGEVMTARPLGSDEARAVEEARAQREARLHAREAAVARAELTAAMISSAADGDGTDAPPVSRMIGRLSGAAWSPVDGEVERRVADSRRQVRPADELGVVWEGEGMAVGRPVRELSPVFMRPKRGEAAKRQG